MLPDPWLPPQMISTSEIKIAVILDGAKIDEAANVAHEAFALGAK